MSAAGHRKQIRGAIAALTADVAGWQKQVVATEILIADLSARAGIEDGTGGTRGTANAAHQKPVRKRRRRRRNSAPRHASRHSSPHRRQKPIIEPVQVAAPALAKIEPAKAVRGQDRFADQLAELEKIRIGIEAGGDTKSAHKLRVRGNAVLKELNGRAKLPEWLDKAERMRWRRAARGPGWKPKRPPTPAPTPPVKRDSGWHDDGNGNLVREIASMTFGQRTARSPGWPRWPEMLDLRKARAEGMTDRELRPSPWRAPDAP